MFTPREKRTPIRYAVGTLVFLPKSMMCYSEIYVVARTWDESDRLGNVRVRHVCHRVSSETGLPAVCPDSRCAGAGLACCAITTSGGWGDEVEPLTVDAIDLFSTEEPTTLDRAFAKVCKAFVPPVKDESKATAKFAKFLDGLLNT